MEITPNSFENIGIHIAKSNIEEVEALKFSPIERQYWKVVLLQYLVFIIFMIMLFLILKIAFENLFQNYIIPVGIGMFVLFSISFSLSRISFLKKSFAVRTHDILYRHGVLSNSITIVPINRIQHVKITETFFMRFFGLASLEMFTAAGLQNGTIRIPGIKLEEAQKLRVFLLSRIKGQNLDGRED